MKRLRHLGCLLALVLALLYGQQAVLWHDVSHLGKQSPPAQDCEIHSLCAQLGGALAAQPLALLLDLAASPAPATIEQRSAALPQRHAFRSRAPPATPA